MALRLLAIALVCQAAESHAPRAPARGELLGRAARLLESGPGLGPRLSIQPHPGACSSGAPARAALASDACRRAADQPVDELIALAERARARLAGPGDAEALHVLGLLDLFWADDTGKSLSRTISFLRRAALLTDRPAPVLADLSAAYLVRAERLHTPRDLLEAVETAARAIEADSSNRAARYNLALALNRNGLDGRAAAAWETYLRFDATSDWAETARSRLRALEFRAAPPWPADERAVPGRAADAPQEAQLLGWDHVLGEWGSATMEGDSARAGARLRLARALGAALENRGRDATLADEVRMIEALSGDPAALRRLARAHREYARARADYIALRREAAGAGFARVRAAAPIGSCLHQWATIFHGGLRAYRNPQRGEPVLRQAVVRADTLRHPALAGRARWLLGTSLLRQGRYREARAEYRTAARLLERAGEREHLGAVRAYTGTVEHQLANPEGAYASLHDALTTLRPYRSSGWLHSALWAQADAAAADGYARATAYILDEDVAVTERVGNPIHSAEARTARARLLMATDSAAEALEALRKGLAAALGRVEPAQARAWFTAELWEAEAAANAHGNPAQASTLLDSAVSYWREQGNVLRLLPPLAARANVGLTLGKITRARRDVDSVLALLATERGSVVSSPERISLLESVRASVGRLVMTRVAAGQPEQALLELEKARAALLPSALVRPWKPGERPRAPRGETALVYALIGDTLLTWTVRDTAIRLTRGTVDHAALLHLVERARWSLEQGPDQDTAAVLPALRSLYDVLVRPVGPLPASPLLVVPDEALEGVPFAALRDARRERYLIETHPLRVKATLAAAPAQAPTQERSPGPRALLVAATEFDRRAFPDLEALLGAGAEVRELGGVYPDAVVLSGMRATRESVLEAIPRAEVIHFAGHALFDDQRPDRSRLLLTPERGSEHAAELTAAEIEGVRLAPGGLVVLSSCETQRSSSGRSGGLAGLAGAFLSAGAAGVVGSLWKVDDDATRPLVTAFHRAYRQRPDGPAALRSAQLQMLRSRDRRLHSPAAWAGFRYVGN